ncbi:hypothetical protein NDR87_30225 [Nocardia sp. CDC159]|uniref:Uncharacterized protein n=1 Tax=Nocardia pulmonis TaxID=2951408 RepID=A0A9X2ECD3_9NOCA|nr:MULTISPECIES: hypothetical protein [Nocardia]MCM6777770.1 hypothetical protein [Nocardia pulmonis]MCM6790655.1 hypothetical protein [Nocardia sp. CDC159]
MATTSLPLATAAAVATILSAPANAVPGDQAPVPTTPASPQDAAPSDQNTQQQNNGQQATPQQGNTQQSNPQQGDCVPTPERPCAPQQGPTTPSQPGVTPQQPGVTTPQSPNPSTPQQPGVTTPQQPGTTNPDSPQMAGPQQPGVTAPRVAPLPVPGQNNQTPPPQAAPEQNNQQELKPGQQPEQGTAPTRPQQPQSGGNSDNLTGNQGTQQQEPRWNSPRLQQAPAAPVVPMTGPRTEIGANVDGGAVLPGFVANTRHFSNLDGYVGTIGYRTPTGSGDAGASLEFVEPNKIKVTYYTHVPDREDVKGETYVDTTQANAAKAAVEGWIRQQPGGAAALEAAARIGRLPEGEIAPAQLNVAGVTTQWGGDVQY